MVAKVAALNRRAPDDLTAELLAGGCRDLLAALSRQPRDTSAVRHAVSRDFFRAGATLFHAGMLDRLPPRRTWDASRRRNEQWEEVPVALRQRMQAYVEQVRVSLRPSTVAYIEATLREFASSLTQIRE